MVTHAIHLEHFIWPDLEHVKRLQVTQVGSICRHWHHLTMLTVLIPSIHTVARLSHHYTSYKITDIQFNPCKIDHGNIQCSLKYYISFKNMNYKQWDFAENIDPCIYCVNNLEIHSILKFFEFCKILY